ncbi:MAG TPA: hypothetical protein VGD38_11745 [Pyrinomonadaceae bacterium]
MTCRILLALLVLISAASGRQFANAQADLKPTNCENHIKMLEGANDVAGKDGLIILIARPGTGDTKPEISGRRLYSARAYLTDYLRVRSPETIVIGEGDRVEGYGRLEIYVAGKLYQALAIRANSELSVGSCEPEDLDDATQRARRRKLYPWLYKN